MVPSGDLTAIRTRAVTPRFLNGIQKLAYGLRLKELRVLNLVLSMKSQLRFSTILVKSFSPPIVDLSKMLLILKSSNKPKSISMIP